jgi:hypothetical protein
MRWGKKALRLAKGFEFLGTKILLRDHFSRVGFLFASKWDGRMERWGKRSLRAFYKRFIVIV